MEDPTVQQPHVQHRSPLVRLHINIKDAQARDTTEVVKAVSKDWETVEVDGFTFKRRRASQPADCSPKPSKRQRQLSDAGPDQVLQQQASPGAENIAPQQVASKAAVMTPGVSNPVSAVAATESTGQDGLQQAAVDPADSLAEQQAAMETRAADPTDTGAAVEHCAQPEVPKQPAAEPEEQQQPIPAKPQVQETPAGAQGQHEPAAAALQQLPAGASQPQRLLMLCHLLLQEQVEAAEQAADEALAAGLRGMQDSLPGQLEACLANGSLQVAPVSRAVAADALAARQAALQRQLDQLTQEEQQWEQVLQETEAATQLPSALALEVASEQGKGIGGQAQASQPQGLAPRVAAAQAAAHRHLALQASSMAALVSHVEELVEQAEMSCGVMQAEWHHRKFSQLQHIQSPARLIKELVRPRIPIVDTP